MDTGLRLMKEVWVQDLMRYQRFQWGLDTYVVKDVGKDVVKVTNVADGFECDFYYNEVVLVEVV